MFQLGRAFLCLLVASVFALAIAPATKAEPLLFSNAVALQNNNTTRVDLFSNSGITLLGPEVNFQVDITGVLPPGVTNGLLVTFAEAGHAPIVQSFLIPAFGSIPPPFTAQFTFTSLGATYQGIAATLTFDIIGSSPDFVIPGGPRVDSYTYSFFVANPIPEPTTLLLLGTGLFGAAARLGMRRRAGRSS